jgi:hypothetical protein
MDWHEKATWWTVAVVAVVMAVVVYFVTPLVTH